ncbi:MAG: phytanoyl-CoA dioxygenase family protein [Flavobacteriales bacterium]
MNLLQGFQIIPNFYEPSEVRQIISLIYNKDSSNFRKSKDLFAIRQVLQEIPELKALLFNAKLNSLISSFGEEYTCIKSIYFDKPPHSNWTVPWHQDLFIGVREKIEIAGFRQWTNKDGFCNVQPPLEILENIVTVRIHLDNCDENNGALKVIPRSHLHGVVDLPYQSYQDEVICSVPEGGVCLMKPLILHASLKSKSDDHRRVVHLEFCSKSLPDGLRWTEVW